MAVFWVSLVVDETDAAGAPLTRGSVAITPSQRLPDPADDMLIEQAPVVAVLTAEGPPSVRLAASDSIGPQQGSGTPGWTYTVTYANVPGIPAGYSWSFYLLSSNGASQRLSELAQVPAAQPGELVMPLPLNAPAPGNVPVVTAASPLAVQWQANSGADKNFTLPFNVASAVSVPHNLGKYPAVTVFDSAGDEVEGDVDYTGLNSLTVSFSAPFSGTVTCN